MLFWKCYLHQGLCSTRGTVVLMSLTACCSGSAICTKGCVLLLGVVLRSLTACCSGSAICTRGCARSATPPPPSATPPPSSDPCVAITAGTSVAGPVNSASCKGLAKLRVVLHQRACQVSQPLKINTNSHPTYEGLTVTLTVTQPVKD